MASEASAGTGGGALEGEAPASDKHADDGIWPKWWQKFLNDFRSQREAKSNDGLRAPTFEQPSWAQVPGATTETFLEAVRRRHEQAEARLEKAEARAARLLQTALTLLALALVSAGWQANRLRQARSPEWAWAISMGLAAVAIICIAMAAVQAIGVDRVGYVQPPNPDLAADFADESEQRRNLAVQERQAARMANWSGLKKLNEFLQARAWLTRGITALALSGVCAVVLWVSSAPPTTSVKSPPASTRHIRSRHERP